MLPVYITTVVAQSCMYNRCLQYVFHRQPMSVTCDEFHYTLFGGDMLTAARARGSKNIVSNSQRGKDRLEGVIPVVEDWHAKLCLLEVGTVFCN